METLAIYEHPETAAIKVTNNASLRADGMDPVTAEAIFFLEKTADLMVIQTINKPTVNVGENLTYTITVTNNGPSRATGIVLTDILPKHADLVSVELEVSCYHSHRLISWKLGELDSGKGVTITVTIIPKMVGIFKNFAMVTAKEYDPDLDNNKSIQSATVKSESRYRGFDFL